MTGEGYLILAYVLGLGLMWGYAGALLLAGRRGGRADEQGR